MSKLKISLDLKGECLRCVQVKKIADYISETYGLPYVDGVLLRREYSGKYPIPLIVENGDKTMWVDRYYVAYILDDGILHYVYNTKHHILEEHKNWAETAKAQGKKISMPKSVLKAFYRSGYEMFLADHQCWVDRKFLEKIFGKTENETK